MPGGRPTKYKPEYCEQLIKHMGEGFSFESFAAVVEITESTLYEWKLKNKEFSEAHKKGYGANRMFWEKISLDYLVSDKDTKFNSTVWIFNMKNRFGWKDRHEIDTNVSGNVTFQLAAPIVDNTHNILEGAVVEELSENSFLEANVSD